MKILYIWDSDYPWDVRAEKICTTLAESGFEVHLAARNKKRRSVKEQLGAITIHRLKAFKSNFANEYLSFPFFANPIWLYFINRIIKTEDIKLIIVRDLPLAITGILVARKNRIPCVFDMAENYVAMLKDIWKKHKFKGMNIVVRNPHLANLVENYSLKKMDHILVVVDESVKFLKSKNVPENQITIVGNTPSYHEIKNGNNRVKLDEDILKRFESRYAAIYTGGIQMGRGIQLVFEAIPEIIKKIPEFLFVVVGDGYASVNLKKMIQNNNLSEYVFWVGWVEHKMVYEYIRNSNVGLIPHLTTEHVNTTIPNKIFDYMALELPIVASDAIPMKRIIEEEKCGIVFKSGDASSLSKSIIRVKEESTGYGSNGKIAVEKKFNWEVDGRRLVEAVKSVL